MSRFSGRSTPPVQRPVVEEEGFEPPRPKATGLQPARPPTAQLFVVTTLQLMGSNHSITVNSRAHSPRLLNWNDLSARTGMIRNFRSAFYFVLPLGYDPKALSLKGSRSIRLSYKRLVLLRGAAPRS